MTKYSDLLKDPRWQRKRLRIFERDHWMCCHCDDTVSSLQVHHRYYKLGLLPWEYPDDALVTLCELCHKKIEFIKLVDREGIKYLRLNGFLKTDVQEIKMIVINKLIPNNHKESALKYINDIKLLMSENAFA